MRDSFFAVSLALILLMKDIGESGYGRAPSFRVAYEPLNKVRHRPDSGRVFVLQA